MPIPYVMATDSPDSIEDEIFRIRKATVARDPWAVLDIPMGSAYKQIKSAQRKWIRKLHPDKWYASADDRLRREIQEAFYQVQAAYSEALSHCAGTLRHEPITMPPEKQPSNWFQRLLALFIPQWSR